MSHVPAGHPLRVALASVFGIEWATLGEHDRSLIVRDCTEDGEVSDFPAYARAIGRGQLHAYARVMRARFHSYPVTEPVTVTDQR